MVSPSIFSVSLLSLCHVTTNQLSDSNINDLLYSRICYSPCDEEYLIEPICPPKRRVIERLKCDLIENLTDDYFYPDGKWKNFNSIWKWRNSLIHRLKFYPKSTPFCPQDLPPKPSPRDYSDDISLKTKFY